MANIFTNFFGFGDDDAKRPKAPDRKEVGVSAASIVGGYLQGDEKNAKLRDENKQREYDEMVRNHPIVAASVRAFLNFASKADWSSEPVDDSSAAKQAAEFADQLRDDIETSWSRVHRQAATYKFNGSSILEWTAKIGDDGQWLFSTIEPRRARTITRWDIDDDGQLLGIEQTAPISGETFYIPRTKLAVFTDDALTDQPDGMGLLRHAFRHTERLASLEELEMQGFERDMRGLMIGRVPYAALRDAVEAGSITETDAKAAILSLERLVQMQRKQPTTALLLDSATYENKSDTGIAASSIRQWDMELVQGSSPGLSELDTAIHRLNTEIARIFGTEFLLLGADGAGSLALSKSKMSAFLESVNCANKDIEERANKDLLDVAWRKNGFDDELKPRWKIADLQERDMDQIAQTLKDLAAAGIDSSDPALNDIRGRMGLPPAPSVDGF